MEAHLRLLHESPPLIVRVLHTMILVGLSGLLAKLYRPSESNMLFDGGSLVLYLCAVVVYGGNIINGLRIVSKGVYRPMTAMEGDSMAMDHVDAASSFEGPQKEPSYQSEKQDQALVVGREDSLKVLSASNTILAIILVGVLVLQAGQWYAERARDKDLRSTDIKATKQQQQQQQQPQLLKKPSRKDFKPTREDGYEIFKNEIGGSQPSDDSDFDDEGSGEGVPLEAPGGDRNTSNENSMGDTERI